MMKSFFEFLNEATEEEKNVKATLANVPKSHADLIKGFKFNWERGCTLKGDDQHIGIIDPRKKTITIAAPWLNSRQFTFLHELGHQVWQFIVFPNKKLLKQWEVIVKKTRHKVAEEDPKTAKDNIEELFCHAYGEFYCKTKVKKFDHPEWTAFIQSLE